MASWYKKASGAAQYFAPSDLADFLLLSTLPYGATGPQAIGRTAEMHIRDMLVQPASHLVAEGKKVLKDHISKLAFNKQNRFFGDPAAVKSLNPDAPVSDYAKLIGQGARSGRHSVENLKRRLEAEGIPWDQAVKTLKQRAFTDSSGYVRPMDYYVMPNQSQFQDFGWKIFADSLVKLESGLNSGARLIALMRLMDSAVSAVHNTAVDPVEYVYSRVTGKPRESNRSFGDSILSKFAAGDSLFSLLESRNRNDAVEPFASPQVRHYVQSFRPGTTGTGD